MPSRVPELVLGILGVGVSIDRRIPIQAPNVL